MIMTVTIKRYSDSDETYTTNIPLRNIAEIRIDIHGGFMFRLIDGSWTWYHVSHTTGEEIEKFISNSERINK